MKREEAMEVYKAERLHFDKTREIQWKFNIALWTLISLGITLSQDTKKYIDPSIAVIMSVVFVLTHFLFALLTQSSLDSNKVVWTHVINQLNSKSEFVSIDVISAINKAKKDGDRGDSLKSISWVFFQSLATAALLSIFISTIPSPDSNGWWLF